MTHELDVCRYNDGQVIGMAELTEEEFQHYLSMAQQPEGTIRLGALPHNYYDLFEDNQDTHEDTVIYLS